MKTLLRAVVSAGVLAIMLSLLPWSEVRAALGRLSLQLWSLLVLGFVVGHAVGVFKWRMVVNAGRAGLGVYDATRCYAAGLFTNLCLPSIVGGDVLRATMAARATGRTEAAVLGSVADRLIDTLALAILAVAGGVLAGAIAEDRIWRMLAAGVVLGGVAAAAALFALSRRPLARWPARMRRRVARTLVALRRLRRAPGVTAGALVLSVAIQSGFVLLNIAIGRALGIALPAAVWFFAWPAAKIAGLMPVSLGGLGVRDATFAGLLATLDVPPATGVVASLVWQSVLVGGGLLAAGWWGLSAVLRAGSRRRLVGHATPSLAARRRSAG